MQVSWRVQFWEPVLVLVWRELRVRYKRTIFGFFWSLVPPVAQAFIWLIVIEKIFRYDIPNYSAYLLCNAFTWQFIQNALLDGCSVMLFHMPLVKAFPMRREILPVSSVASNLVHFLLSLVVLFIYLQVLRVPIRSQWLLLPIALVGLISLVLGLVLMLSCLTVFYLDFKFILDSFALRLLFFACPVFYFVEMVPERWYHAYMLNPFAVYLTVIRQILLPPVQLPDGRPALPFDWLHFGVALLVSVLTLLVGLSVFRKYQHQLAEWL
ncbi:MAG: ABC transporter permease [Candidatus Fervidibacter sp.]|uniref:ABC transporter permease n=1 Tax=Candidatus Fervidibacter sp. TaxID=3100871 RepID=UPI004049EC8C